MTDRFTDIWARLEQEGGPPGVRALRVHPETQTDVFIGFERPGETRLFFVEGSRIDVEPAVRDLDCAGFTVRCEGVPGATSRRRLVVRLADRRYADIFATLAADVISTLPARGHPGAKLGALAERLARWERFLAARGPEGLTRAQQQGLFGELWFLLQHAVPTCGAPRTLEAWVGPTGRPQDFQFAPAAVEVKTTTGLPDKGVLIASALQLDPPPGVPLFLLVLQLEERVGMGDTLPALVGRVRAALVTHAVRLEDLLRESGYAETDAHLYRAPSYVVRGERFFRVRDAFPRITAADLRHGVTAVKYTITLGGCQEYLVGSDVAHGAMGGHA